VNLRDHSITLLLLLSEDIEDDLRAFVVFTLAKLPLYYRVYC
jgi:hypothetical protein